MPDLPLSTVAAAALAVTLAYTVFGLTGFGAAIVGVPLLAHVVPIRFAVPMMLVFDLCAGLLLGLRNRRDVDRAELLRLAPFVALGMILGVTALVRAPERWLLGVLGAFVFAYAAWSLLNRAAARQISARWAVPAGMAGGVFTALYGSGGPIYTVYLARRLDDANRLRASIAVLIFCTAWARLALFSGTGLLFQPSLLRLAVVLLPCAVVGYFIGSHLHRRLAPRASAARDLGAAACERCVAAVARGERRRLGASERDRSLASRASTARSSSRRLVNRARRSPASAFARPRREGADRDRRRRRDRPRTEAAGR